MDKYQPIIDNNFNQRKGTSPKSNVGIGHDQWHPSLQEAFNRSTQFAEQGTLGI
jgi:hypothetical protein